MWIWVAAAGRPGACAPLLHPSITCRRPQAWLACLLPALPARSMTHAVKTSTAISPNLHPSAQHRLPSIPRTYDLLHALCHLAPSP